MAVWTMSLMKTMLHRRVVVQGYQTDSTVCRHERQLSRVCFVSTSSIQRMQHPREDDKLFLCRMSNDDCEFDLQHFRQHPLCNIGRILQHRFDDNTCKTFSRSGSAWLAKDWDGVTVALEEASLAIFQHLRETSVSGDATRLWTVIAEELKDISTIEGCSSMGPPTSIPNWVSIQSTLRTLAALDSSNGQGDWMEEAATEIDRLLDSI
jgi:hypothetical protein